MGRYLSAKLFLGLVVMVACNSSAVALVPTSTATSTTQTAPLVLNKVIVKRARNMPPPIIEWERTVEGIQVEQLHRKLVSLLPSPYRISCPISFGTDYYLTFLNNSQVIDEIIVNAGGCRSAWMDGIIKQKTDQRDTDDSFWELFSKVLDISVKDLQTETRR
ncbi:MAG: hypothetical protein HY741_17390 [Chloroflexi bacterium]|nr:hypothetical protein [Chloroflexota bacterium]